MNPSQRQAKAIFEQAIALGDVVERRAYIEAACAGDQALLQEVQSLVAAYECSGSFLKTPVVSALPNPPLPGIGGQPFGDYELLEVIGRGGMGVVYKPRQVKLGRVVAIKMILTGQLASREEITRFLTEAQAVASLNHPNIVGIYEVGEDRGYHFYAMPFLEGQTLAQRVEAEQWRPGDGTEAAALVAKVAHAVHYAHERGLVHRDLKPGNIMLGPDGEPRVMDFGLAKQVSGNAHLTLTGHLVGTPSFVAPEQARGRGGQPTPAADIYSLGAVLYYLLTGRPPFVADSPLDALLLALESEAVRPRRINPLLSGHLEHICLRCLEKRPEDRYASAVELAMDLERFLKGDSLADNPQAIGRRFESWAKHRPALAIRICTVLLCLGIVLIAYPLHGLLNYPYDAVIGVLVFWLVFSFLCQRGMESDRHAVWVRFVWSCADPAALTAILIIREGFSSPLVILYPTLIAAAGFWFRVRLVATTTIASLVGYLILLLIFPPANADIYRHVLAILGIMVTGLAVAYLVNRVRALTRFYERRPAAES